MQQIEIRDLTCRYKAANALESINFDVAQGEFWVVVGPNGAGKSTLIRLLAGLLVPSRGTITLQGRAHNAYSPLERARQIAYVPQASAWVIPPFSVFDYVMMSRFPYQGFMALPSKNDLMIVAHALEITMSTEFANRQLHTLSGGELQRVLIASAVAQQTPVLLLDEPSVFMDPLHQKQIGDALQRIRLEHRTTMIMVTHEINIAGNQATHVLALVKGRALFTGAVDDFRSRCPDLLYQIYGIRFDYAVAAGSGRVVMIPQEMTYL
jgi:iron complex transport system ATP-binding protein